MPVTPEDLVKIQLEHEIERHNQCLFSLKEMFVVSIKGKELIYFRIFFSTIKNILQLLDCSMFSNKSLY